MAHVWLIDLLTRVLEASWPGTLGLWRLGKFVAWFYIILGPHYNQPEPPSLKKNLDYNPGLHVGN